MAIMCEVDHPINESYDSTDTLHYIFTYLPFNFAILVSIDARFHKIPQKEVVWR